MTFTIETGNWFHAGWLAAHLGLADTPPADWDATAADCYREGHAAYRQTWPDRDDNPAVILGRECASGRYRISAAG